MQQEIRTRAAPGARFGMTEDALKALFRNFPNGLAVVNQAHVVEAGNPALRKILRLEDGPLVGHVCCAVLGCGRATEDGDVCIVDGVLRTDLPVRDLYVELPRGRGPAWLSASVLDGQRRTVVVEVRCAEPGPAPEQAPPVRIRVLGRTRIETPYGAADTSWLGQRPGELLKYLVAERERVVPIEDIAEAIWPTAEFATPNTVRHLVHVLRKHIDPGRAHPADSAGVVALRGGYALDRRVVAVDADAFVAAANEALDAFGDENPAAPECSRPRSASTAATSSPTTPTPRGRTPSASASARWPSGCSARSPTSPPRARTSARRPPTSSASRSSRPSTRTSSAG